MTAITKVQGRGGEGEIIIGSLQKIIFLKLSLNMLHTVGGLCNFLGSFSPQQKFGVSDRPVLQLCITAQFYLESKGKYILKTWGWANPKDMKGREAPCSILAPLFMCFFPPPPEPSLCKLGHPGGLLVLPEVLTLVQTFLCSIFLGFSHLCLLATAILDSFFLF